MQSNGKRALRRWQRDGSPEGELTQRTVAENVKAQERAALRRARELEDEERPDHILNRGRHYTETQLT